MLRELYSPYYYLLIAAFATSIYPGVHGAWAGKVVFSLIMSMYDLLTLIFVTIIFGKFGNFLPSFSICMLSDKCPPIICQIKIDQLLTNVHC